MSMISESVERLREKATLFSKSDFAVAGIAKDYKEAADVIEELSAKLASANNERSEQYYKDVPDTNVGKWIPVSEKLPEYNAYSDYYESVIVTLDDGRVVDGCYRNMDKEWWVDAVDGEHYSVNATGHVIAWQPLPEPYKGE